MGYVIFRPHLLLYHSQYKLNNRPTALIDIRERFTKKEELKEARH